MPTASSAGIPGGERQGVHRSRLAEVLPRSLRQPCGGAAQKCNGEWSMTPDRILVTLGGLLAVAGIAWFFWMVKRPGVRASVTSGGDQEGLGLRKGGYTPAV